MGFYEPANDLKEIVWNCLKAGPWKFFDLVYAVKAETKFRKDLNYEYYVKKYVDMWEKKNSMECVIREKNSPFCPNCGETCTGAC